MFKKINSDNIAKTAKFALRATVGSATAKVAYDTIDRLLPEAEDQKTKIIQQTGSIGIGVVVSEMTGKVTDGIVDDIRDALRDVFGKSNEIESLQA